MRRRASKNQNFSPALRRLGLAQEAPFVGRDDELKEIARAFAEATAVVIHGAVGAGKSRLGRHLLSLPELVGQRKVAYVCCQPGDVGAALHARAERALDAFPGSLHSVLAEAPCLLVLDDVHHLGDNDAAETLGQLVPDPGKSRVVFLTREVLPLSRKDERRVDIELEGLSTDAARELWAHLETTYGGASAEAFDEAMTATRGMPLAVRRYYAQAVAGDDAWELDELDPDSRAALEAVAVIRIPCAPAAVSALAPDIGAEAALIDLVSRQLIDPATGGRFSIHDVVRDQVLSAMDKEGRAKLEAAAADLVATVGKGLPDRRRVAWDAGDDGAIGVLSPIDRLREEVQHLIFAGRSEEALARIVEERHRMLSRGCGGELVALVEALAAAKAGTGDLLGALRAEIAARQGQVALAIELAGRVDLSSVEEVGPDPVSMAALRYRSGDITGACEELYDLAVDGPDNLRGLAGAYLAECELDRGNLKQAYTVATSAFERDRAGLENVARARLHMAMAAHEERAGSVGSARAALSRARNSGHLPRALYAEIDARQALCLAKEGRVEEAANLLHEAEASARDVDAVLVADEVRRIRAFVDGRSGRNRDAQEALRSLISDRRSRGDEVGALYAEIDLAKSHVRGGELAHASTLAAAVLASAKPRGLERLARESILVAAQVEIGELRLAGAMSRLKGFEPCDRRQEVELAAAHAVAASWDSSEDCNEALERWQSLRDQADCAIDADWIDAFAALGRKDSKTALDMARRVAVAAERGGRRGEMTKALALMARLHQARGDSTAATSAATRAAREGQVGGLARARSQALVTLAALARDEGNVSAASAYAQDAYKQATSAGLPVERLVAAQALEVIAEGDMAGGIDVSDARSAAAATMTEIGIDAASRVLSDLGFTAARPFKVISCTGQENFVADANPGVLRMADRDLAIDGVREVIVRDGKQIADLRRRSLLKRLLFLFAAHPQKTFSKEDIVQTVWAVEYHPLRHDAALFTNIMRIRRLLGKDGSDLIRVSEEGYKFVPPKDYIYVGHAATE